MAWFPLRTNRYSRACRLFLAGRRSKAGFFRFSTPKNPDNRPLFARIAIYIASAIKSTSEDGGEHEVIQNTHTRGPRDGIRVDFRFVKSFSSAKGLLGRKLRRQQPCR